MGLLIFSCKGDGKTLDKKYEDKLVVELTMEIPKDDQFELYYRGKEEKFDSKKRIRIEVKGSKELQKLEYIFDILEFPTHIRLDFGQNEEQAEMILDNLAFRYNDGIHNFTEEELKKFFRPNDGLKIDYENMTIQTAAVNGKYIPYLNSFDISYFVNKLILY
ncbi:MAG: hypothetical protein WBG48_06895 [Pricia sp.]